MRALFPGKAPWVTFEKSEGVYTYRCARCAGAVSVSAGSPHALRIERGFGSTHAKCGLTVQLTPMQIRQRRHIVKVEASLAAVRAANRAQAEAGRRVLADRRKTATCA